MKKETTEKIMDNIGHILIMLVFIALILNAIGVELKTLFPRAEPPLTRDEIKMQEEIQEVIDRYNDR